MFVGVVDRHKVQIASEGCTQFRKPESGTVYTMICEVSAKLSLPGRLTNLGDDPEQETDWLSPFHNE